MVDSGRGTESRLQTPIHRLKSVFHAATTVPMILTLTYGAREVTIHRVVIRPGIVISLTLTFQYKSLRISA